MNKSFSLSEDNPSDFDLDLDASLEKNINHVINILEQESDHTNSEEEKSNQSSLKQVLQGVEVYVEVRTNNDNRSEAVSNMLRSLGAVVEKSFTNSVTHVIYKDGNKRTVDKAKKNGIHLLSVLWVDSCLRNKRHMSESLYPAVLPKKEKSTPIIFKKNRLKKMKSMQPNDFEEDVAKSSERYERKRKKEEERLGLSGSSTPVASPVILAYDTVPRSPPSPSDWRSPIPLVIPNTPASMKEHIHRIRQARLNNSTDGSSVDSPVQPNHILLQRKLFNGDESMQTPSFNMSRDGGQTNSPVIGGKTNDKSPAKTVQYNSDSALNGIHVDSPGLGILKSFDNAQAKKIGQEVEGALILKRKLFTINTKNSPKPYLLEPQKRSETIRPTLLDSNPRPAGQSKVMTGSKGKAHKRKVESDSDKSDQGKKQLTKKSKQNETKMAAPVKNILLENIPTATAVCDVSEGQSGCVVTTQQTVISAKDFQTKGKNSGKNLEPTIDDISEQPGQRRSSRRSSILSKSNSSHSSLNLDTSRKSSRRVSIATPELSETSTNSLRRSSRRQSVASFGSISESPLESPVKSLAKQKAKVTTGKQQEKPRKAVDQLLDSVLNFQGSVKNTSPNKNVLENQDDIEKIRTTSNQISNIDTILNPPGSVKVIKRGRKSIIEKRLEKQEAILENGTAGEEHMSDSSIDSTKVVKRKSISRKTNSLDKQVIENNSATSEKTIESPLAQSKPAKVAKRGRKSIAQKSLDGQSTSSLENTSETPPSLNNSTKVVKRDRKSIAPKNKSLDGHNTDLPTTVGTPSISNNSALNSPASNNSTKTKKFSLDNEMEGANSSKTPQRRSEQILSSNDTLDNPGTPRNETNLNLGASMSAIFGDTTMPSFSQAPSRRSIDDFKLINRKKSTNGKVLASITENDQKNKPKRNSTNSKRTSGTVSKRSKDVENRSSSNISYEMEDTEKPTRTTVKLRRANSFIKEHNNNTGDGKITRPSIVMTSMHSYEQEAVISVIKRLGGFILVDNVGDTTTHVVCGDARRTLNLVNGVARGCWMLKKEWVLKSLDKQQWLDEEEFEVCDVYPQVKINRKERQLNGVHYQQNIFTGLGPIFISSKSQPPKAALINLIRLCGGEVTGSASRCDLFIGNEPYPNKTSIKPVWVLDSVMAHEWLDYNQTKYILNLTPVHRESSPEF